MTVLVMIEFHTKSQITMSSSTQRVFSFAHGESGTSSHIHSYNSHAYGVPGVIHTFAAQLWVKSSSPKSVHHLMGYKSDSLHAELAACAPDRWELRLDPHSSLYVTVITVRPVLRLVQRANGARQWAPHRPAAAAHELRIAPARLILFAVYSSLTSLREITGRLSYGRPEGVNSIYPCR